ncbi:MAG: ATP phosphoribosyltransferase regulatory subunit, partial [Chloroflexota bacterium]
MTATPFIYENHHLTDLVAALYTHMRRYGYENVQVPAIADVDLFLKKAGDQVIESLFTFERFGKQLALRPEFTALAAHRYAQSHPQGGYVARWQFNGSIFLENHTQQRYQQMSIGAELIGVNTPLADAEIITMATTGLSEVARVSGLKLSVGHIGLLRAALKQFQLDERTEQFLLAQVSQYDDIGDHAGDILARFDADFTVPNTTTSNESPAVKDGTQQM